MINKYIIDYSITKELDINVIKKYKIFPIQKQELFTLIASSNTEYDEDFFTKLFNTPIKIINTSQYYIDLKVQNFDTEYEIYTLGIKALNNTKQNNSNNSYIINMLDNIILFATKSKASDIHIESLKENVVIRFRIDGVLQLMFTFESNMYKLFASIIKLFSNLDISQTRLPQNGRFSKVFNNNEYDFRVSTIPTINGESIVIRVLDNKNSKVILKDIGFDKNIFNSLNNLINLHQGMILVTGPTGSGKTTTLYSILNTLNNSSKKIITIEDPIEYNLAGIQQMNINEDIGLDYSLSLKNILRQDPDIIMIGEIRDEEALNIALQAALTGHLVIATLHTNNAPETINRLLDLNAEPFLIASTLKAVLSQRLVRKLCDKCMANNTAIGCTSCNLQGYHGRIVVSELLELDSKISEYIHNKVHINSLIKYAKTIGYKTLEEECLLKIKNGLTSMEEFYTKVKM